MYRHEKREAQIKYLSERDFLTGLYNRQYFEEQKQHLDANLPLTVIYCDINGVKLINDAFGHAAGDKLIIDAARILNSCCRDQDLIARTGGDEFTILLPDTDSRTAEKLVAQIRARCREHNAAQTNEAFCLHISIGFATRELPTEEMSLIIKRAEDNMYRRKLLEQKSSHSAIVSSIRAAMLARSQETEEHAERLTSWCRQLGQVLGLKQTEIDNLLLLATLHDIGKMGIDDAILNKPGKLSEEEWIMMRKTPRNRLSHCHVARFNTYNYILSHHERWDALFPQGLAEKRSRSYPAFCLVDTYDMTENRATVKHCLPAAVAEPSSMPELNLTCNSGSVCRKVLGRKVNNWCDLNRGWMVDEKDTDYSCYFFCWWYHCGYCCGTNSNFWFTQVSTAHSTVMLTEPQTGEMGVQSEAANAEQSRSCWP